MSSPSLHVLPWNKPLVGQAADWLADGWIGEGPLDLSRTFVVVPTRQSGRRLREALAVRASKSNQAVFPPRVSLPIGLFEDLIRGQAVASRQECLLAWTEVLRTVDLSAFGEVFPNRPPSRTFSWAVRLARQLVQLHETLAENGLRIADVPEQAHERLPETTRWKQLAKLEALYDLALRKLDLSDPQAARITGIGGAKTPENIERIVVIATPDPQPLAVALLQKYAEQIPVTVLVYGPPEESVDELFDTWGRPKTDVWASRPVEWTDFKNQVHLCANPASQADRIVEIARGYKTPDQWLSVGTEDKELIAPLHAGFARSGFASYDPEGLLRKNDPLFELVSLLGEFQREASFGTVTALARCPDVLDWLRAQIGSGFSPARTLEALDHLHARNLPVSLNGAISHASETEQKFAGTSAVLSHFQQLREKLISQPFPANAFDALSEIFGHRKFDHQNPAHARRSDSASEWVKTAQATGTAAAGFKTVRDTDAWDLTLQQFGESRRFEEKPGSAIELQGWLELLWNEAPHLVVGGMNGGLVPSAIVGDAFLPETLREILGLKTNAARLARDSYILHGLIASRAANGRIDLMVGKTSASGDPLRPSRLLLICEDNQLPERVRYLFREIESDQASVPWYRAWKLQPDTARKIDRLSVTTFRGYLQCPFRFYLKRGLRMEAIDPHKAELDALDFGTLCHAAVEAMGRSASIRESTDAGTIREFLLNNLDRQMRGRYGTELTLPLQIQLESAKQRLSRAADVQAALRADGWVIERVESKFEIQIVGIIVRGTIDRIDRHETTGGLRVFDYKTSDKPVNPREAHVRNLKRNESPEDVPDFSRFEIGGRSYVWTDLQLPLYLSALATEFPGTIACGYFNLPKATTETGVAFWDDYTSEWQAAANTCAEQIVEAVKAGQFWPPSEDVDENYDEFASLFQHGARDSVNWKTEAQK